MLDQFEAMTLGPSGPGQQLEATADPAYYPRPTGAEAEGAGAPPPPFLPGNCDARFMRLNVNAVPVQQARAGLPGLSLTRWLGTQAALHIIGVGVCQDHRRWFWRQ